MLEANVVGYGNTLSYSDDHELQKIVKNSTIIVDNLLHSGAILTMGSTGQIQWASDITTCGSAFIFKDEKGNKIGTLDFSKEPITFEGNFHESAKIFARMVSRMVNHIV